MHLNRRFKHIKAHDFCITANANPNPNPNAVDCWFAVQNDVY